MACVAAGPNIFQTTGTVRRRRSIGRFRVPASQARGYEMHGSAKAFKLSQSPIGHEGALTCQLYGNSK